MMNMVVVVVAASLLVVAAVVVVVRGGVIFLFGAPYHTSDFCCRKFMFAYVETPLSVSSNTC